MPEHAFNSIAILIDRRTGEEFNISRYSTSIGREIGNDLILNIDKTISRQHAMIQYIDGTFLVQDLSSKNGTKLNGQKIHSLTELRTGDEISVGLTQLIFVLVPQNLLDMSKPQATTETIEAIVETPVAAHALLAS